MMTKKRLSNISLALFFIFWLFVIINIIRPFQQNDIITFPHQTRIYYDVYKLIIASSLLSVFLFYRGYQILTDASQQTYIQAEKKGNRRIRYLIAILIPILIVPVVYAYVYEQDNNNLSQTIIDLALMDEDFDEVPLGDDPPGWAEDSGDWAVFNDSGNVVYYQNDTAPKEAITISTTGNTSWTDYTFEVDLKFDEGSPNKPNRGALLVYRYTGGNNYYFLALREAQDELEVYKHGTGGGGHLVSTASCTLVQDTWYHVNITIIGDSVWISIDENQYFTNLTMLGDQTSGSVGIGTEYYKVMFDSIYVDEK
jgi:hypothetical protein